jgi:hypothetical protein
MQKWENTLTMPVFRMVSPTTTINNPIAGIIGSLIAGISSFSNICSRHAKDIAMQ